MAQPLSKLDWETKGLKIFPIFTVFGWLTIMITVLIALLVLSPTGASYWGDNAKAIRDGAEIGSPLLGQLTTIQWWPKFLVSLAILGIASFMTGIALEFAAITVALTVIIRTLQHQEKTLRSFIRARAAA